MTKKSLMIAIFIILLIIPIVSAQQGTVTRSFSTDTPYPDDDLVITITVDAEESIPEQFFAVDDIFPSGWTVVDTGDLDNSEANHMKGANITQPQESPDPVPDVVYQYTLHAPLTVGVYTFSGKFMFDGFSSEQDILGPTSVTVQWCSMTPTPETRDCGPASDAGECVFGTSTCSGDGVDYEWGSCVGAVYPSLEICDDLDNNCDTFTDEGCDEDGDDYCNSSMTTSGNPSTCPSGGGDCDDSASGINPGVTETCLTYGRTNGIDEDCDGDDDFEGDTNCNGCVDVFDLSTIGSYFGGTGPDGDLNEDSEVDIFDLVTVGSNFGDEDIPGACSG